MTYVISFRISRTSVPLHMDSLQRLCSRRGRVRKEDERLLASCYRSCLELADENGIRSIAFCCISTGEFHFPNELAAEIAVRTVKEYRNGKTGIEKVIFNVFKDIDKEIYERLLGTD